MLLLSEPHINEYRLLIIVQKSQQLTTLPNAMATFNAVRFVLAAALLVAVIPSSAATFPKIKDVCYSKIQRCCYKYAPCGYVTKKVYKTVDCSFKKCYRACKKHCYFVTKKVPYQKCYKVVKKAYVCKKKKVYVHKGHGHGKYAFKDVCVTKPVYKTVCKRRYRYVKRKKCVRKCYRVCKKVKAYCVKIHFFSYYKYCPKLKCYHYFYKGSNKAPGVVVGKKHKLLKVVDGKRTIKH